MANNKVQLVTGEVLIDLTPVTVDAAHLAQGYTAHDKSGAAITGTGQTATSPYREETYNADGYLASVIIHGNVPKIREREYAGSANPITSINLPSSITAVESQAFQSNTTLRGVTFNGTPNSIDSTAFDGCDNLSTINVPWASGAVSGAPWGATNATINYNYRG